ncbi:unnamed protein product [Schistosoma bovis]|nr:unnamed protein product [Schistosoma bovis]CAH8583284.1 unnamed protein product [Schistosoma bovis]
MLSSPLGFNVQRNVKIKSIYQVIGILVGVCFNIFYITVRDVGTAVCCSFSILFGSVGLYVDIQLLRGHWRVWPCILRRYMWLGIVGSILSLAVLLGNLYNEMKNRQKRKSITSGDFCKLLDRIYIVCKIIAFYV